MPNDCEPFFFYLFTCVVYLKYTIFKIIYQAIYKSSPKTVKSAPYSLFLCILS